MRRMTTGALRAKYAEVFGEQSRSKSKAYLIKRIAWRMQANVDGTRSQRARQSITERELRPIATVADWAQQRRMWRAIG